MYFSATGTTEKVVCGIADAIRARTFAGQTVKKIDFTLPESRKEPISFNGEDLVVVGVPVIAGRVPNVLLKHLNSVVGHGALAVAVVLYGNRNYDDALIELRDILEADSFTVIAGGAFVGEHSFSRILAQNRPDEEDMAIASAFAGQICDKLASASGEIPTVAVNGHKTYRDYYKPKDRKGNPDDLRKVIPKTNIDTCIDCKLCASVCPMGSIDPKDVSQLIGICIKCGACIKKCPSGAKYFDDENYLKHQHELEIEFETRREPELFL
jgi:NAD-dependent dihydropyrimidine dehydrogenase PreA subunit/flavodoxin